MGLDANIPEGDLEVKWSDYMCYVKLFFFSSRRRHTRFDCDWSSDVCSSDLRARHGHQALPAVPARRTAGHLPARARSEERRVGKECRTWWSADHYKKNPGWGYISSRCDRIRLACFCWISKFMSNVRTES